MRYLLITILLISSLYGKTNDFSIVINEQFNNALVDVTQDYDRSISAVGIVKAYKNGSSKTGTAYTNAFDYLSSLSSLHGSQIHLAKVNDQADITLRKTIDLTDFSEAVGILKTPQNGYFIGGHTLNGSLLILKLGSDGNTIFKQTFGTANQDKMNKIILLRDGGVLAIGSSATSRSSNDDIFDGGLGLSDIYLARFSSDGTKLWSKKYGTMHDDAGVDAAEAHDGTIMVIGQTNYEKYKNITTMRITENGDKIWLKHYQNNKDTLAYRIIRLKDNNFALSLSQEDDARKEQIRLVKIDLGTNILLDKIIYTTYASALVDIKEFNDTKIIGVGYVKDGHNTDALAMLLDNKFSMSAQEHYGSNGHDSFNALTILHNSQIAAVGVYTENNSQETNMWLVKLNRDLSIAQMPKKPTNFYTELASLFKQEIETNKISINKDLSISLIDKNLYFEVGQYTLNSKQKEFLQKFTAKLLPFLYKNKEYINTLEISGHTSSEWGTSDFSQKYINNEQLSMRRSFATLSYIFNKQDKKTKKWLSEALKGSGVGFSKKVMIDENEDKEKSRRVSFGIILKSASNWF